MSWPGHGEPCSSPGATPLQSGPGTPRRHPQARARRERVAAIGVEEACMFAALNRRSLQRFALAALLLSGLAMAPAVVQAAEIIPSLGMTKAPDSDETNISYGLAVRAPILPMLSAEIG